MGSNLSIQLQKIASSAQIQAQKLANEATKKSFEYNTKEANTARTWQKEMSDTAHQREVEDLKKAGLNPVLSANSGAQSYTTSSASAQANDPSGAAANLAATQMSGMAQGYSADKSAAATRYAAKESAAAMRAAAAAQASAARYAAAMQYQTQKDSWAWKTKYMKEEYKQKTQYALNTPVNSFAALADKLSKNSGLQDTIIGSKTIKDAVLGIKKLANDPSQFFKDNAKVFKNNAAELLNSKGVKYINNILRNMSVNPTSFTRNLAIKAFLYGDQRYFKLLTRYMPKKKSRNYYTIKSSL